MPETLKTARIGVTTSGRPGDALAGEARAAAAAVGLPYLDRAGLPSRRALFERSGVDALVVFEGRRLSVVDRQGTLRFAEGLARLRVQQLQRGGADRLVDLARFERGEAVLDCTLGLAADAQVAAWAVGPAGRVVGLESSPVLCLLARHGLPRLARLAPAAAIDVQLADAHELLPRLPTGSFDVVLFDPMFAHRRKASPAFEQLRRYADPRPLTAELLREGRRVARRLVLVKAARSSELRRLGLTAEPGPAAAHVRWARAAPLPPGPR
ncbi:MAG TPA: class I SAM-dependent methyltransferase [Myxococcales bacterium]|nr:class I SAM-dependent methyltransferase [Myxococcales bacterium]